MREGASKGGIWFGIDGGKEGLGKRRSGKLVEENWKPSQKVEKGGDVCVCVLVCWGRGEG